MKPVPYCIPDLLILALEVADKAAPEDFVRRKALMRVLAEMVDRGDLGNDPNELALATIETVCRALNVRDPFEREKARRNRAMLGLENEIADIIPTTGQGRLEAAVMLSWAAAQGGLDVLGREEAGGIILERLKANPARDDREQLLNAIKKAQNIWILLGDAGEIIADRMLATIIHDMGKSVTAVTVARPLLAMATAEDAALAGLDAVATIIDPGMAMYGLSPHRTPIEFQEAFAEADVVLAKGAAHFSALSFGKHEFYGLMRADCPHDAMLWGVSPGSGILGHWCPEVPGK